MSSTAGLVDWRGRPVDTTKHGGVRASIFIHILVWLGNVSNIANSMNMVSYLRGTMNMGVAAASTTTTIFVAVLQMFTIPAAFIADSYIKRLYTVLIFAPIEILVLVAAFRKRNLQVIDNPNGLNQITGDNAKGLEVLGRTKGLECLDKAAIDNGQRGPWSLCTVHQVEEAKIVMRMIPIFITSALGYMPVSIILTFTVQQGNTMNTKLGTINVSPATLFIIPTIFQLVILVVYDRFIVPFLRKKTGYVGGVTHLQRIGIGFVAAMMASVVAAIVEMKRKRIADENGLMDSPAAVPMSVFWLVFQFFFIGVVDVTSFVGLLEFFYSEASTGMKSIGSSFFYCMLGVAAWLVTLLIELVNRVTRHGGRKQGWLDGANLNRSKLDSFYWLVCVLQLVSFMAYLYWARRYVYRNDQRVVEKDKSPVYRDMDAI
nr:unnamed protein product [Digitaria exilis]